MSIVVCDDHEMFLQALVDALEMQGHQVVASTSDPNAVPSLVHTLGPRAVLLDVQLPGACGIDLARLLREQACDTSIILMTGGTDDRVLAAYEAGVVDGLVCKGVGLTSLDAAIHRVLRGGRVMVGWPTPSRRASAPSPLEMLTQREREVLVLIADGASTSMMASRLGVSVNTVRTHVASVLQKLGVHERTKAARVALEMGLAAAN
jgi:two-component system, NarL family, nitrate/nitrite response regulator NarL